MPRKPSAQKVLGRNRPPRVQIEYDVEIGDAQKKVELPFVMGVLADFSGAHAPDLDFVADREFQEVDVDNFDEVLKAAEPRVSIRVPNALTGKGELQVEMAFRSLEDFSPAQVARRVEPLAKLLEARRQLSNLLTYMDGKADAEALVGQILKDPAVLKALAAAPRSNGDGNGNPEEEVEHG